mmetsp:Transcript_19601/g.40939  ORF Transcript_19601/g.40939 Transcript_19601/m.40939 type:complete len:366 (+) Transcript_19601:251-1348(+)|eukprot:CAMPEP_0118668284 /NCGR_PEP_ID=MMETSP0785-20121206/20260_1 /TAXON_ID=91992 /ORGANISM="Bolidomonas pacifica, Strain CCMP 1866" /LENGTH=365 /DNA_ID=CAMNT_0006562839 /DNA_START=252 /DNA_END=1345 /DNA_ORIENTATION=+
MSVFGPTLEESQALNFTCLDLNEYPSYSNNCPVMMSCWYDEALGDVDDIPTCKCSTIAITSQDNFPACDTLSGKSWLPILVASVTVLMCFSLICYSIWMIVILKKLKQFQMNDIMQCLLLAIAGTIFTMIHQSAELTQMLLLDHDFHVAIYRNGGLLQICLVGLGGCVVLSSLKIPLLWMVIASSGMNKADAVKNKAKVGKIVKYSSSFFLVSFIAIIFATGTTNGGSYSLLWMLILVTAFQVGSRKLRKQLVKPGDPMPPTVWAMRYFVRRWCIVVMLYIVSITMFVMNATHRSANPENWSIWAGMIYHLLGQIFVSNVIYIRATLEKKLSKFRKTGVVSPSTVIERSAVEKSSVSTSSVSEKG